MTDRPGTDQSSIEHRLRGMVRQPAPPSAHRRRGIGREAAALALMVVAAVVLLPFAEGPNPDYPEARAAADRLEAAVESAASGVAATDAAAAHDVAVADFAAEGSAIMVFHDRVPTSSGVCYGMRTGEGVVTSAVRFDPTDRRCVPVGRSTFAAIGSWGDVLPSQRETAPWFVPAMVVLIFGALTTSTRIVVRLVTKGR